MNLFKELSPEKYEEVASNFLINSFSYSGLSTFSRHEKVFEKEYIYGEYGKKSASSVGGNAYHNALEQFFLNKKDGKKDLDLVDLQQIAFDYVDSITANKWKIQKTTPSVEDCIIEANKIVTKTLENFLGELEAYEDLEILEVELKFDEFVTINGVDIPLPIHGKIDIVAKTKDGKIVVIDHKSGKKHTAESDQQFVYCKQGILYVLGYEAFSGRKVDEFWFVENKISKYKNGAKQLQVLKTEINDDTRKLYEAQVYEPLRRMLEATSNPDYVYLINDGDNWTSKAEIYEFWAKTMIAEIEEFNVPENKRDIIAKRLNKIRDASLVAISPKVIKTFQKNASAFITYDLSNKNMTNQEKIQHRLRSFNLPAQVAHKFEGYSSDTYLLEIQAGTKLTAIYKHRLDIANALGVESVRMESNLFVYEGKSYFVIEASKKREKDLFFDEKYLKDSKIPVGLNNFGETVVWDLKNESTPNALVCGSVGSGKSVWLRSTIEYAKLCGVENFVIFDPKFEFLEYKKESNFEVFNEIEDCQIKMMLLIDDMERRIRNHEKKMTMVIFDEFADAVLQSKIKGGSNIEESMRMLLQKGRSSGFRVIAATQRASVKVITGDAKVNFPVQICFRVPKEIDSKVVLDEPGAESLAGQGDGLINSPEYPSLIRFQGFFIK